MSPSPAWSGSLYIHSVLSTLGTKPDLFPYLGRRSHATFEGLLPSNTSIFCLTYDLVLSLMIVHGSGASPDIHMSCKPSRVPCILR